MRIRTVFMLALLVFIGVFAVLNWQAFMAPTSLDLIVARFEAPLGFLMLITIGLLAVVFLLMLARSEISMLLESRRLIKELENARKTAADAELSRVESLRAVVLSELAEINKKLDVIAGRSGSTNLV